jgi:hypothetical protein
MIPPPIAMGRMNSFGMRGVTVGGVVVLWVESDRNIFDFNAGLILNYVSK